MPEPTSSYWIFKGNPVALGNESGTGSQKFTATLEDPDNNWAYLEFETLNVNFTKNQILINEKHYAYIEVPPPGFHGFWYRQVVVIEQYDNLIILKPGYNTFNFISNNQAGGSSGDTDDFKLRNVILHYRYKAT